METSREGVAVQNETEKAIEQLIADFILALSRAEVAKLSGVDIMHAFITAKGHHGL